MLYGIEFRFDKDPWEGTLCVLNEPVHVVGRDVEIIQVDLPFMDQYAVAE